MYEDKTLVCKDCGNEFVFTAGEQEFYASRGFENEPQRCKACRDARKNAGRGTREMFTAVCASCGKEARVPFKPREDRPGGHKEQGRAALALSRRPYADQLFHVRKHSFIGYRYHQPAAAVERAGRVVQLPHRRRAEGQQRLCRHGFPLADAHKAGERAGRRVQGTQCAASLFVFYIPARRHPAAAVFDARHRAVARFQPAAQCFPQGIVHKLCDIIG